MPDHAYYEELTALAAGGHLSREEGAELRAHLAVCPDCRQSLAVYADLVAAGLPLTSGAASLERLRETAAPDAGARERFLARARSEGLRFSAAVDTTQAGRRWTARYRLPAALAAAAAIVAALYVPQLARRASSPSALSQEVERLTRENVALNERLRDRDRELSGQQAQVRTLRSELDATTKTASDLRRDLQQQAGQLGHSTVQTARLLEELQDREQRLASAADEINRINQLRVTDRAALDAQRTRIRAIADQLRVADATIAVERQLSAAGKDLRELLLARQLRVLDVRDLDAHGQPSAAFARVFVTENRTIRIYAFDLVEGRETPGRFQVWGEVAGDPKSARALGALDLDDRRQNRWSLTVQDAGALKSINAVFVTASTRTGAPQGPRLLYALLGNQPGAD